MISRKLENEIRTFFQDCPFCAKQNSLVFQRDIFLEMYCTECQARWRLHTDWRARFNGAELIRTDIQGRGRELLGLNYPPDFWQKFQVSNEPTSERVAIKEKEIIREKEVIVKVRCPYCHNIYDETLDKCPHCGGKR